MSEIHALSFTVLTLAITLFYIGFVDYGIIGGIIITILGLFTVFGFMGTIFFLDSL